MGGASALRGFLVQTMIAVLDSLSDEEWETVATEPEIDAEKVDIIWTYSGNRTNVTQVKSTEVQITRRQAESWAEELSKDYPQACEYRLVLIGPCHKNVSAIKEHCGVKIPPARPNDLDTLLFAAAHMVSTVLERKSIEPLSASATKSVASQLITTFFIEATRPIKIADLEQEIVDFISSTGHRLTVESESIIRALTSQSIKSDQEILNQKRQIEALESTITDMQISSASSDLHERALKALKQGDTSLADNLFNQQIAALNNKLMEESRELERAYANLGAIHVFSNIDRAIEAYRQAADLNPSNMDYWLELGTLLLRKAEYDLAEQAFDKYSELAIESDDGNLVFKSFGLLGNTYLESAQPQKAKECFDKIFQLTSDKPELCEWTAQAHASYSAISMNLGKYDEALAHVEEALALMPSNHINYEFFVANQLSKRGVLISKTDIDHGERLVRESLRRFKLLPEYPGWVAIQLNNLATIHRRRGEESEAIECLNEARKINLIIGAVYPAALNKMNIGVAYFTGGHNSEADEALRDALSEAVGINNIHLLAQVTYNIGLRHFEKKNDYAKGLDTLLYSLKLARASKDVLLEAKFQETINKFST